MDRYPSVLQQGKNGSIPLPDDIGTDKLIEYLCWGVSRSALGNGELNIGAHEAIENWVLGFETDPDVIAERQEVVRYVLENPDFANAVAAADVRPEMPFKNELDHYTGIVRRFSTFSGSVASVAQSLDGKKKPRTLEAVQEVCEEARKISEEAKRSMDPEFELRVECSGNITRGRFTEYFQPYHRHGRSASTLEYVLVNKKDGSVKRLNEHSAIEFGVWNCHDFTEQVKGDIENAFNGAIRVPFFEKAYRINGVLMYNSHDDVPAGEFEYLRTDGTDKGVFKVPIYGEYVPKSIVELARFRHNFQVVGNFKPVIKEFEGMLMQLKAVAAATCFLKNLQGTGYPLVFPDILPPDSEEDIYIRNMYHPLLAHLKERRIVPNDVSTTASNNARLITGANNNGKTSYMDAIGLSYVMFQAGLPVVAEEARMKPKRKLLTHYVKPGNLNLSRFANDGVRLLDLTKDIVYDSLILCDELFTGTAPQDGEAVTELAIRNLLKTGATLFFTTHYHALGDRLRDSQYVTQLCCRLDHSTDPSSYTYKIVPGISRESDGLKVAEQYGVNNDNLNALLQQKERQGDFKLRR